MEREPLQAHKAAAVWTILKRLGYEDICAELGSATQGANLHRLENILTLDNRLHHLFDELDIWFEAVKDQVCVSSTYHSMLCSDSTLTVCGSQTATISSSLPTWGDRPLSRKECSLSLITRDCLSPARGTSKSTLPAVGLHTCRVPPSISTSSTAAWKNWRSWRTTAHPQMYLLLPFTAVSQ